MVFADVAPYIQDYLIKPYSDHWGTSAVTISCFIIRNHQNTSIIKRCLGGKHIVEHTSAISGFVAYLFKKPTNTLFSCVLKPPITPMQQEKLWKTNCHNIFKVRRKGWHINSNVYKYFDGKYMFDLRKGRQVCSKMELPGPGRSCFFEAYLTSMGRNFWNIMNKHWLRFHSLPNKN